MVSVPSPDRRFVAETVRTTVKILVAGPIAVGKTTFVDTLSEIAPLRTEETMTQAGASVDDLAGTPNKTTTTVAMDFGRVTLSPEMVLYLFGAPGQHRFRQMWHDLAQGALGAVVLADTRQLDQSFDVLSHVEDLGMRHVVAINQFADAPQFELSELREALDLLPRTPLVVCDARDRASSASALIALVHHLHTHATLEHR